MGSKKYKGKICVYCAVNPSTTGDHVFARTFFAEDQRADLPQVPACAPCNKAKSDLEHYLATVLLFGGRHADAGRMLENEGPRKLAKNVRLHKELSQGVEYVTEKSAAGQPVTVNMLLPFDSEKLHTLFSYIVRGLLWHHWQVLLDEHHDVRVLSLSRLIENAFAPLFGQFACQRADGNLGNGTFRYQGAQGVDYPEFSFWGFSVFDGVHLTGDPEQPEATSISLCAFTAKKGLFGKPAYAQFFS